MIGKTRRSVRAAERRENDIIAAFGGETEKPEIVIAVYVNEREYDDFNPYDLDFEEHQYLTDRLAYRLKKAGFVVVLSPVDRKGYFDWKGNRPDTRDLRAEYAATPGSRLGLKLTPNAIGMCRLYGPQFGTDTPPSENAITGASFKRWRNEHGMSQRQAAAEFRMGISTWQRVEAGREIPPARAVLRILSDQAEASATEK